MTSWLSKTKTVLSDKENVVHLLLLGTFAAIGARSLSQQGEIDALEAQRDSLRSSNRQMQKSMWEWRQSLFALSHPESLARLRQIFGEADHKRPTDGVAYSVPALPAMSPEAAAHTEKGTIAPEQETTNPTSARIAV